MKLDLKKIRETQNIELLAKQLVEGFLTGLHQSPYHGFSVEFAEHRLYNPGESTKNIDWKLFGKTDRLYIKKYNEETNLRALIVLDNSSSMHYPTETKGKIGFGISLAAALSCLLIKQKDAVGINTFSQELELQTEIKASNTHLHKLLILLQQTLNDTKNESKKKTELSKTLTNIATKSHQRSLVIIITDLLYNEDPKKLFDAIQHLKHKKNEVLVFCIQDKETEMNFNFTDRPHEFIDIENGESIKVNPSEIKEFYQKKIDSRNLALKERFGKAKVDFIDIDIKDDFNKALSSYLIKRKKMK